MAFRARNANYNALKSLSLKQRLDAASDISMGQTLISMLTPTQAAELFPHYWIEKNPNISGFLKAIPSSLSAAKQREFEQQIQNTASGSSAGSNYTAGGYRKKWQEQIDREKQRSQITKRFEAPLPQLSPEQRQAFEALKAGDIGIDDPRVKFLKNISRNDLARAGLTVTKDNAFHYTPPQVSEEEVRKYAQTGTGAREGGSRSWRNKNPGNLEYRDWQKDYGAIGSDGRFAIFRTEQDGENARRHLLFEMDAYKNLTLAEAIRKYAPAYENNVPAYIAATGADPNMRMSQFTREQQDKLLENMRRHEGWKPGRSLEDPITQNYTPQQLEIKKRELLSAIEAGRINDLAQITQPGMKAAAQELNIKSAADMTQVKAQFDTSEGGWYRSSLPGLSGSATHRECADLTKAFNPNVGTAGSWHVDRNDAAIRPGVAVATQMYNTGTGGAHGQAYHTGVALTSPDGNGNFLVLEQANGYKPRVHEVNVNEYNYGHGDRRPGNFWGPIKGHENEQSLEALKVAYQLANDEQKARLQSSIGVVNDNNVVTSNSDRVERTVSGYPNSDQMAEVAGSGLSQKEQAQRKAVVQGALTFQGGGTYHFGSGRPDDPNFPSTPLGSSEVGGLNPHNVPGGVGYEMPTLNNKFDPKVGRTRNGMVIHSSGHDDLEQLYSHGCISIPKSEFPAFQKEMEDFKKAHGGRAYINIMPDGRVTVTAAPAYSADGNPITPISPDQAVKEIQTNQPQVVQSSTQVASGDIKPLTSITQPEGPINAAGPVAPQPAPATPAAPTATAAVEQPKPAASTGSKFIFNKQDYLNEVARAHPMIDSPMASMIGQDRNYAWNETVKGLKEAEAAGVLSYNEKTSALNIKDMNHPRVQQILQDMKTNQLNQEAFLKKQEDQKKENAPPKVKAMAEGGTVPVNTDKITAYPIDGLRGDNAVIVNAQQKPLFTMNTNENITMNPASNRAEIAPQDKKTNIGPTPREDTTSNIMEDFHSTIHEIRKDFANLKAAKVEKPDLNPTRPLIDENGWLGKMNQTAADPFKSPSARRVAYRAGGMETGDPSSGFHYSRGNNS